MNVVIIYVELSVISFYIELIYFKLIYHGKFQLF
jgi:hypothetical protein